ncbi:cell wall-active antibiotics response protein LiaF [Paenibacillus daejeonensis]|uniref:cell wall-active antibiotics response protein LiaF n=1 Tax=Paenibacillus daejeonensis TaxID=135193 RepID=UPI00035E387A|nr:cell wall-active antibiotics response protein LiaF [Paenibacillus daejeonensis]
MQSGVFMRVFIGLMVVGAGVLFLFNQAGFISFGLGELIRTFWPVVLIVIGIGGLLDRKSTWEYAIPLVIGIYFLGSNLGMVNFSFGDLIRYAIPVAIIGFGLTMIFKKRDTGKAHKEEEWQAYPNDPSPIPPAPPLHPDPTKSEGPYEAPPSYDDTSRAGRAYENNHQDRGNYNSHGHEYNQGHGHGHGHGQGHEHYHTKSGHGRRERVEWWNNDPGVQTRSNFIGDIHMGKDYWELKPMNISHFIGDTTLDLTKAQIPYGETRLTISAFIGDVKVFLPNDYEVGIDVVSSAFIGDAKILERKESGFFLNTRVESKSYEECDKKIRLVVSTFIGDVKVTKVG